MAFKLGNRGRNVVFRKQLPEGTLAEANMDGSITIDPSIKRGSAKEKRIIKHEMKHVHDIETGRAAFGDDWVMWEDKIYFRRQVSGTPVIDGPNGRWPEGDANHPWEQEAINAEKK